MSDLVAFSVPWLSLIIAIPLLGALVLALVPSEHTQLHRSLSLGFLGAAFAAALCALAAFDPAVGGFQLTAALENRSWIQAIGARYHVGVDGISIWLVLLTAMLGPVVVLAGWKAVDTRVREFHVAVLVLQAAMVGALVALDLLLFYVFWEIMLIPAYLLVGIWGGAGRVQAALQMFLTTMLGSVLMLGAILYLYAASDFTSFGYAELAEVARSLPMTTQVWVFAAFAMGFLVKVPVIPFHTWLPRAHAEAPIAVSILLVGIVEKGIYGLARFVIPFFPDATYFFAPYLALAGAVGLIYGLTIAFVQTDMKRLLAYASVGHAGLVLFGLFSATDAGVTGALFQNVAHGVATVGLFLVVGILESRRGTRETGEFGGLASRTPALATFGVILILAAAGVPGLLGFVGEFMILLGGAASYTLNFAGLRYFGELNWGPDIQAFLFASLAAFGVVLGALYLLRFARLVFFGPLDEAKNGAMADLDWREVSMLLPLVVLCFVVGLWPRPFLDRMDDSVALLLEDLEQGADLYRPDVAEDIRRTRDYGFWLIAEGSDEPWTIRAPEPASDHGESTDSSTTDHSNE